MCTGNMHHVFPIMLLAVLFKVAGAVQLFWEFLSAFLSLSARQR